MKNITYMGWRPYFVHGDSINIIFDLWPSLRFGHGTLLCIVVVSASGKGVCHHIRWSWPRLFFRFRSWKSMLDPCTWGLPHHWGWPNLGQRVSLGHLCFRAGKEEANFWTCLNTLSFLVRSWKKVFFCNVWLLNMGLCCASLLCFCFREGGLSSYLVKLAGTFLSLWVLEKHVRPLHLGSAQLITGGGRTWGAG